MVLLRILNPNPNSTVGAAGGRQTNKKPSAEACADACRRHEPPGDAGGPYGRLPCNAFTFCPVEYDQCFEADAHTHHGGDCWLKFTEVPEAPQVGSSLTSLTSFTSTAFKPGSAERSPHSTLSVRKVSKCGVESP